YSPEVNPIERLWEELKAKLRWQNCKDLKSLQQRLSQVLDSFDKVMIASITGWDYLVDALLSATS
ncbi:MAG: IS630 family transposase, partial [Roseofilum sp. SBFL]|nr:IS630 family transposase [Roseofilum sp. SBFL]